MRARRRSSTGWTARPRPVWHRPCVAAGHGDGSGRSDAFSTCEARARAKSRSAVGFGRRRVSGAGPLRGAKVSSTSISSAKKSSPVAGVQRTGKSATEWIVCPALRPSPRETPARGIYVGAPVERPAGRGPWWRSLLDELDE